MHTKDQIEANVHYNPDTGVFTRRSNGKAITSLDDKGYLQVWVEGINYKGHRLAWFLVTGTWPPEEVDHKNRVRNDNRWDNLRLADKFENMQNMNINSNNSSGYRGVTWHKRECKWMARIGVNNQTIQLGYFDNPEDAAEAYAEAKKKHHTFQPTI